MNRLPELARMYSIVDAARPLGAKLLADNTELVGHVPHVAPQAWLHVLFAGLSPDEIRQVEQNVGRELDPLFVRFLGALNGLSLFSGALSIDGLRKSNERSALNRQPFSIRVPNTLERPVDAKPSHLFVGGFKSDGSLLYIDNASSRVYRSRRGSVAPLNEWLNIFAMVESEANRLSTLFDEHGRKRQPEGPTMPSDELQTSIGGNAS